MIISHTMNNQKSELYFLLLLIAGIATLAFFIFKPFLYALILAAVFATVFAPLYRRILAMTHGRDGLAALLATSVVLFVVVMPFILLGAQVLREATQLYLFFTSSGGATAFSLHAENALVGLGRVIPVPVTFSVDVSQYAKEGLGWLLSHAGVVASSTAGVAMGIFVFLIALYFSFKDGQKLKRAVIAVSPLQDMHDEAILSKLALAINSVVKGKLVVAIIQGALTMAGFWIFGIPSAIFLGSIAAIAALIPGFGTALVIIPAVLFLFFSGETPYALGLLLWGVIVVGLVDNVLGPKLVERGMRIHPFLILLSILGGIGFFGPLGFLLGPLVLSLLFALLEIYFAINKEQKG
jgi:predicted PurR-regulated permease PerM